METPVSRPDRRNELKDATRGENRGNQHVHNRGRLAGDVSLNQASWHHPTPRLVIAGEQGYSIQHEDMQDEDRLAAGGNREPRHGGAGKRLVRSIRMGLP